MSNHKTARSERAVILDVDGVVVDSGPPHLESWKRLAAQQGMRFGEADFAETFGQTSREIIRRFFGPTLAEDEVRRLDERKEALYRELIGTAVPVMPGALELMHGLHRAGFKLAFGTSGPPENVELVVRLLNLQRLIAVRITGRDVERGKPEPDVFLLAASRLGVPPVGCAVVEDAPAGILAGKRAGMRVVGLTSGHPAARLHEAGADLVVGSLGELSPERIDRLLETATPPTPSA